MTIELKMLAWSVVLGLVHVLVSGQMTVAQLGLAYGLSPRDEKRELSGVPARIERAYGNFSSTFPLFAAAVLVTQAAGRHGWQTEWGVQLYFWARLAFVPLYAVGIPGPRTVAFVVSVVGIVLILSALL